MRTRMWVRMLGAGKSTTGNPEGAMTAEIQALWVEYQHLAHAMQTGVLYEKPEVYTGDPGSVSNELKHLRVGINSSFVSIDGLSQLLIEKGLFTEHEYVVAQRDAMQREVEKMEKVLTKKYGRPVSLR